MSIFTNSAAALAIMVVLAGASEAKAQNAQAAPSGPTCAVALRSYSSLADVPQPFVPLELPPRVGNAEIRDLVASTGATGYALERVPPAQLTPEEKRLMQEHNVTQVWRTVPVFVPADSTRVREACTRQGAVRK